MNVDHRQQHLARRRIPGLDQDTVEAFHRVREGCRLRLEFAIHIDIRAFGLHIGHDLDAVFVTQRQAPERHRAICGFAAKFAIVRHNAHSRCLGIAQLPGGTLHGRRQHEAKFPRDHAIRLPGDLMANRDGPLVAGIAQPERFDMEPKFVRKEATGLFLPAPAARIGVPAAESRGLLPDIGPDRAEGAVHQVAGLDVAEKGFQRAGTGFEQCRCNTRGGKMKRGNPVALFVAAVGLVGKAVAYGEYSRSHVGHRQMRADVANIHHRIAAFFLARGEAISPALHQSQGTG